MATKYHYTREEEDFLRTLRRVSHEGCLRNGYSEASSRRQASAAVDEARRAMREQKQKSLRSSEE
jgi:hypothetical protein